MATPVKAFLKPQNITPRFISPSKNNHYLQVHKHVNGSDECLLINTPNKMRLVKHGVDKARSAASFLGYGRFGSVFKGNYKGQTVAVKVARHEKRVDLGEEKVLKLHHQNLIQVMDIIRNANEKFVVILMEYCSTSKSLQTHLDDENFNICKSTVVKCCIDVVAGLRYLHSNGIMHLDLKPKNVLLCDGICKICDFGNSYRNGDENYMFAGTVPYASPEILCGNQPTYKSDVYSFGVFLWQLLSRQLPYESLNMEVVIYKVVKFSLRPDMDAISMENVDDLRKLCSSCWQGTPQDRPELFEIANVLENVKE